MSAPDVRPLTPDDLDWAAGLAAVRREALEPHAPRFWRPASDATARHRPFLAHLVADPTTVAARTDHGFVVALDRGDYLLVDDLVVEPELHWPDEGAALLAHVAALGRVRLVAGAPESARLDAALALGLEPADVWWHRDLEPRTGLDVVSEDKRVAVAGAEGRLVPAPPVHDPGGPVLLVSAVTDEASLRLLEQSAARRGARVAVVTQEPGDQARADLLTQAGYVVTTFFLSTPG